MIRKLRPLAALAAFVLLSAAAGPTLAAPATPPSDSDDVPPFVGARGDTPLAFAVTGLAHGFAEIGPGARVFAVCWQGGEAPYAVTLRDGAGHTLAAETGLSGSELILASHPLSFAAGTYDLDVTDAAGGHVDGQFKVVAPELLPPGPDANGAAAVSAAEAADRAGSAFRYEAYLRVVPAAVGAPGSAADQLARSLCHRH